MAKRYNGNASSIGTASHMERYFEDARHDTLKNSRYMCYYYCRNTKICNKLNIACMGPSNTLCKHYRIAEENTPHTGTLVNHPEHGVGMIIAVHDSVCEIQYHHSKEIKKYQIDKISKIILK